MKRTSTILLGVLLLAAPAALQAQYYSDPFTYSINADNTITITGITESGFFTDGPAGGLSIPSEINNLQVTSIATNAIAYTSITAVTIPDSIITIGAYAFADSKYLNDIEIGTNVTTIGEGAFAGAGSFGAEWTSMSVTIPNSVVSIGAGAFSDTGLTNVIIPYSVTSIGSNLFYNCARLVSVTIGNSVIGSAEFASCVSLTSVTIPNNITDIADQAFDGCLNLTNVAIGSNVASIGDSAFASTSLTSVTIPNGVTSIGDSAFYFSLLTFVTIPNSVTSIGSSAFDLTWLTNVAIPNSVTNIGVGAFYNCERLTNVTIPSSVTSIGDYAFAGCDLTAITVDPQNAAYVSVNGVLFNKNQTALVEYPGGLIGSYKIPSNVTMIVEGAFDSCSLVTSVTIPNSVTNIGVQAFNNCWRMTNVTIGDSVTAIGDYAFLLCDLGSVYFEGNAPTADATVFEDNNNNARAYYKAGTTGWSNTFAGIPTALWTPEGKDTIMLGTSPSVGGKVSGAGTFSTGTVHAVSATANSGYTFANWTENGTVVSSNSSYTFTLENTRTLVANFAIKGTPKLAITSPKAAQSASNAIFMVTGTVTDKVSVEDVYYQLNGGNWTLATPGNSWNTWTASVTLNPSANTLNAYAVDTSGAFSPTNTVAFKYIPSATLTVQTNGLGSITPIDNGKLLAIGTSYTLTAFPGKSWLFSNWIASGSENFVSSNPVLTFTMQSNLVLTANFATNLFLGAQGAYRGLFAPAGVMREQTNSGSFALNLLSTGAFTGDLYFGANTVSLAGKFDVSGFVQTNSPVKGGKPLTTILQLDVANQALSGSVSDGSFVAQLDGDQNVFGPGHPATDYAGQYTWTIPGTNEALVGPYGTSYGTLTVSTAGDITFAGSLADGTTVSQSSALSKDGRWPMYLPSSNPNESVYGWNYFSNQTLTAPALVSWINVINKAKTAVYPSGFTNQEAVVVASYYNPAAKPLLSLTGAQVTLEGGDLPFNITNQITLAANNAITVPVSGENTNKLKLTITPKNGLITGSFQNPANAKQTITINGVLLQNQTNAQGYFLGTNQSGSILLQTMQ